jgi:ketosteroid isomerase-like protein
MKYACSLLLTVLLGVVIAGAQEKEMGKHKAMGMGNDGVKNAISAMEKSLREATVKGDSSAAEKMLADDYHGFSAASMQGTDKKTTVDSIKSGKLKYSSIDVASEDVQVYSPMLAVAHGEANVKGTMNGKTVDGKYHYGRVWAKRAGTWQAVWFQTTKVQ